MSGLEREIVYAAARLHCTFDGGGNDIRLISGTGFWLATPSGRPLFVTNRHNVDPSIWPEKQEMQLKSARLEFRRRDPMGKPLGDTRFVDLHGIRDYLRLHQTADCAILADINDAMPEGYGRVTSCAISMVADQTFLSEKAQLMDLASFVGFPGQTLPWWDQGANLPIARLASLASDPGRPFVNDAIASHDVALVSGVSVSGSSGSPLILHEKGMPTDGVTIKGGYFVPPRIIGIMSGHLVDREPAQEMLRHTGLSYFTRSTSILELVREVDPISAQIAPGPVQAANP